MRKFFKSAEKYIHFLYAAIILFFSMLTIHVSVTVMEEHTRVKNAYKSLIESHAHDASEQENREYAEIFQFWEDADFKKSWLYWSVIASGLTGFVLIVLNADKLRKLQLGDKEKKQILKLLEYRLAAMEVSFEGIGIVDSEGNLNYMNKALMHLHGIETAEAQNFLGTSWLSLYSPEGQAQLRSHVLPILNKEGYWRGVYPIVRQDGSIVRAEMSLTKLSDGGFIGTARDITEQENAERERKVIQDQFFQAQKMEAIGRLAGGIAHDFNNILAAMNGYAEFLKEDLNEGSVEQKFAINILKAGEQARTLVDQILSFSRRESAEAQTIDLCIPVLESIAMLEASLPKTIELQKDFRILKAPIHANATEITQVIMNLGVNAKDAMGDQHGVLKIGLRKVNSRDYADKGWIRDALYSSKDALPIHIEDKAPNHTCLMLGGMLRDCDYICLSVEDTGSGMSRAVMEHVIEPFFTTKPVDQRTGLGLSIVHGVIGAYSGALLIESIVGQGTRFDIFFPLSRDAEAQIVHQRDTHISQRAGHILLVEDQVEVRQMTQTMLTRMGYSVEVAGTGLEALMLIRDRPDDFDLVLTDHNMPKMTGLELVYQVHMDFPDLPFVLLSGYSLEALEALMREHPAIYATLRKPVSQKNLADTLEQVFLKLKAQEVAA